ncbi:LytTR family DNA-binding domain-containing protein [uncultured Croceitalea sp.]|uniref:LytR/AlgR family response regulator transcription factor n=1 Tax=uncultured Croceitalea sp. TaxID=1798908 RepID=UPI00330673EE
MIQCLILEDEKSAQKVLKSYVDKTPFLECIGIYETGLNIPTSEMQKVDVLFLDIQLPELNGLSFLKTLMNPPKVIVTSAYPDYALEAFEEAVVDYLLKPFSYERFFKAVTRVRSDANFQNREIDKNLFLYSNKTLYKISADDVLFLKAEVDYINIVTKEKSYLVLDSLRNWNEKLQSFKFIQVHRSYVINIDKITRVYGNQIYIDKKTIPIGMTYKDDFLRIIK